MNKNANEPTKAKVANYFDWLRKLTDDIVTAVKWPAQAKRIDRAFAKKADRLEEIEASTAERILDIERQLLTADEDDMDDLIDSGLAMIADLEAARANSKAADAWLDKLKGAAPEVDE